MNDLELRNEYFLHGAYRDIDELVDAVYSQFRPYYGFDQYQYGRQWELRLVRNEPKTAIRHQCVTSRLLGTPVPDASPLEKAEVTPGCTLYVIDLRPPAERPPYINAPGRRRVI